MAGRKRLSEDGTDWNEAAKLFNDSDVPQNHELRMLYEQFRSRVKCMKKVYQSKETLGLVNEIN